MLEYLLIVFVIALALAPLGHFMPSKRQREIARMREYAAVHGLFVEFRNLPAVNGVTTVVRDVIYYGKRLPNQCARPVEPNAWVRTRLGWHSMQRHLPAPALLQELAPDIQAAGVDQSSCGVYWTESSGEAGVEHIRQVLERWSEALIQ